jgi:hypothetical protein
VHDNEPLSHEMGHNFFNGGGFGKGVSTVTTTVQLASYGETTVVHFFFENLKSLNF